MDACVSHQRDDQQLLLKSVRGEQRSIRQLDAPPPDLIASLGIAKLGDDEPPRLGRSAIMAAYRRLQSSSASSELELFSSHVYNTTSTRILRNTCHHAREQNLMELDERKGRDNYHGGIVRQPLKRKAPLALDR